MKAKKPMSANDAARQFLLGKKATAAPRVPPPPKVSNLATAIIVIVGIGAIAILAFWSMSPPPFSAANLMNGTWSGSVISSDADESLVGKHTAFTVNVGDQTMGNPGDNAHVLHNEDRLTKEPLSIAGHSIVPDVMVFDSIHANGFMWTWSGACVGAKLCSIAAVPSQIMFTVYNAVVGSEGQTTATTYLLVKEEGEKGWQSVVTHKVRYVVAMFVVIAVLKLVMAKLQPGYAKELHRRNRLISGRR